MRMVDIIHKKRLAGELTKEEIDFFISGYVNGSIPDYQAAALLMAICFTGMSGDETANLTMSMAYSGDVADLSAIPGIKADKHSTGGVADTTTLIVVPLVAACKVPVAKMSGRGLGHTGGTIDKLESIPGFNPNQPPKDFIRIVNEVGLAVVGQTGNLVPADKKLYALRDVTGTVESIPLIAASVMSKKIAAGADAIVLDVKAGGGAFMQTVEDAFALAREMVAIGTHVGRKTVALVTGMDQPLGNAVGNALEVREAIGVLNNDVHGELREVSLLLAGHMLCAAQRCQNIDEGRALALAALESGKGAQKLKDMIKAQGGNAAVVDEPSILSVASDIVEIKSGNTGYVHAILAQSIGHAAMLLGAGRASKDDIIDHGVGVVLRRRVGQFVEKGQVLAEMYVSRRKGLEDAKKLLDKAFKIGEGIPAAQPTVYGVVE